MGRLQSVQLATVAVIGFTSVASAADMAPVYKAAPAAVVSPSGYYVWVDGIYEHVRLPTYALGLHNITGVAPFSDIGPIQTFDPSLNGGGVRGAIGYIMPGSTLRFELGGSYIGAHGSSSAVTASPTTGVTAVLLNGSNPQLNGFNCPLFSCSTASTLGTDYSAWQLNGKVDMTVFC